MAVQVETLTLDYIDAGDGEIESRHYAFLVDEDDFDEIFGRLQARGVPYWADPHASRPALLGDVLRVDLERHRRLRLALGVAS